MMQARVGNPSSNRGKYTKLLVELLRRNQLSDLQLFYMLLAQMPWKSAMDLKVKKRELI